MVGRIKLKSHTSLYELFIFLLFILSILCYLGLVFYLSFIFLRMKKNCALNVLSLFFYFFLIFITENTF